MSLTNDKIVYLRTRLNISMKKKVIDDNVWTNQVFVLCETSKSQNVFLSFDTDGWMEEDVCSYLKIFLLKRSHFCRRKAPPPNLGASSIISRARFKQQSSNVHKETRCTDVYNQTDSWHGNARQRRIEVSSFESMRCIDAIWCIEYQSPKWDILFIDFVLKCSSPFTIQMLPYQYTLPWKCLLQPMQKAVSSLFNVWAIHLHSSLFIFTSG